MPPWMFTDQKESSSIMEAVTSQYPWHKNIYPFAVCGGTDDVAVFALKDFKTIVMVIHLNTSKGLEIDKEYNSFSDWLLAAIKTTVSFINQNTSI